MRKILATFLLLSLLSAFTTRSLADEQPNIIFILADDHTSQAWGCYGSRLTPFFKTPNIDRIAAEGVKLTNSFCTNSICVPSRAAILTGQYGHKSGVKMLSDSLSPEKDNLAKQLRKLGYTTALVGKWHLKKEPAGFDYWNIIKGQGRYHNPTMYEMSLAKENGKTETGTYCSDLFTDSALNWLKKKRDKKKPFCLMLHFKATHEPWDFHPRHAKLYADVQFPLPEDLHTSHPGPKNTPFAGWPLEILEKRMVNGGKKYGAPPLNVEGMTPKERREATYQKFLKSYLRCVAAIDENIGRVLHYLDEEKLARKTIVIYTSDQGYFLGEHNLFDKRFMLEESLRMPLVMRYPQEIKAGTECDDIILNIDFAPMLLDFAGGATPKEMQGRSFRANLTGKTPADWRKDMYYEYFTNSPQRPAHHGIRTKDAKLIYYYGYETENDAERWAFFDLTNDPKELVNQYANPEYKKKIAALKKRLEAMVPHKVKKGSQ